MEPGKKLDALVAEKVMGFARHRTPEGREVLLPPGFGPKTWCAPPGDWLQLATYVPAYSTSLLHAWRVFEHFGGELSAPAGGGAYLAGVGTGPARPIQYATGESAPHAICLAALRYVGAL